MSSDRHTHEPAVVIQSAIGGTVTDICECGAQREVVGGSPRAWLEPWSEQPFTTSLQRFVVMQLVEAMRRHEAELIAAYGDEAFARASLAVYRASRSKTGDAEIMVWPADIQLLVTAINLYRADVARTTGPESRTYVGVVVDACDAATAKISQLVNAKC